jgi:choice-of-anchor B domain-containing protein
MKKIVQALVLVSSLIPVGYATAHSEHDKARFIAPDGRDNGTCDNVIRPCLSIEYAVQQANKGDKVLVSAGSYTIDSSNELFYLQSALVPIMGGYNRFDHYQSQSPNSNITTLKNIPSEIADTLRKQGFNIISDGISTFEKIADVNEKNNLHAQLKAKIASYATLFEKQSDISCINNKAGEFNCSNMDLLAHIPLPDFESNPGAANDIWGHVDLNDGSEYAIIGLRNGVSIVNVTNPSSPEEVGVIRGQSSTWRDVKVYQYFDSDENTYKAYAYVTVDNSTENITIIDLNNLPHSVTLAEKNNAVTNAHNIYISNVDHTLNLALANSTPYLQIIGANNYFGAFHSYSLENPSTLQGIEDISFGNGYTHDGASLTLEGERCPDGLNGCTIFLDFNEKEMKLWDITDPSANNHIGTATYADVPIENQYVHSGWGTEDKRFVLVHDEFDERRSGLNSTVRIFSIDDLSNPVQVGQWTGPTKAIDHNGFVRGNRYYMSNYERGVTVLDISDPTSPIEVGFFDTYTPSDSAGFNGAWGVYPFLPSGNILVSDINSGLYIIKDNTKISPQGNLGFISKEISGEQGQPISITVKRAESASNATSTSVRYQLIPGSAKENVDYVANQGIIEWADGDTSDKTIVIDILAEESTTELAESFYVRLYDPTNSATLSQDSYLTVNLAGKVELPSARFVLSETSVVENQISVMLDVGISATPTEEVSFNYQVSSQTATVGDDVENSTGQLIWQANDNANKSITINLINDDNPEPDETFLVTLSTGTGDQMEVSSEIIVTILDDETNIAPEVTLPEDFEVNTDQTVSLVAMASDNENDDMTYQWQQTAGPNVTLSSVDELTTNFIAPSSSTNLTFSFTATDIRGASDTGSVVVTIIETETNLAPEVTLPEDFEVNTDQTISLVAMASDNENDDMTYQWQQTAGPNVTLSSIDELTTVFTAPASSTSLTFDFTATDVRGASSTESITITVVAPVVVPMVEPTVAPKKSSGGSFSLISILLLILLGYNRKICRNMMNKKHRKAK